MRTLEDSIMAEGDDERPTEETDIITGLWTTDAGETCLVKGSYAMKVEISGAKTNINVQDREDWWYKVPPNHVCSVIGGKKVTFTKSQD